MFFFLFLPLVQAITPFSQLSVTDYAPKTNVQCPDLTQTAFIREFTPANQSLSPFETDYLQKRAPVISAAWSDWVGDGSRIGYNLSSFQGHLPAIGIAIPGGGLRAALYGAGCLRGLDFRDDLSRASGSGGLLQVSSYVTGLSGGSWITGSLFFNNFPKLDDLVFGNGNDLSGWILDLPFVNPDGSDIFSDRNQYFFGSILWSVTSKANAGIDTSLTDPWSRMISYHFLNQTDRNNIFNNNTAHGAGQLWSNIPLIPAFQEHLLPFPIIVADSRPVGSNLTTALSLDPVVYEITPFEIASYDPNLSAAANLTFAGTHLTEGKPENGSACVHGFDQAGFIMGSSASLFNQILDFGQNTLAGFSDDDGAGLLHILSRQLQAVRTRADDVANWPNPFNGVKPGSFEDSDKTWIELIDGASNGENVPYGPLFVRARALDVIVTTEGSADDPNNWPNGTSPLTTSRRLGQQLLASHQQFPPIPSNPEDFIATGVNARPTFFGCDPSRTPPEYPLVIYLPNAPPINGDDPVTNPSTFRLTYTTKHVELFMAQVHNNTISGFLPDTNLPDPDWGICLQCAAIDRARLKLTPIPPRSSKCSTCFKQYCYDPLHPTSKTQLPNRRQAFVDPDPQGFRQVQGFLDRNKFNLIGGLVGLIVFLGVLVAALIWWGKRREKARYKRVSTLHDDEVPLKRYSDYIRPEANFELSARLER